jgi:hypothetical protein
VASYSIDDGENLRRVNFGQTGRPLEAHSAPFS